MSTGYQAAARSPTLHYQRVDLASRTEGATPHGLVATLYSELAIALDVMDRVTGDPDRSRFFRQHERAIAILHALDSGLDRRNGGELALSLSAIYRQMRRRLLAARDGDRAAVAEVRAGVVSLADAWDRIAA